MFTSTPDFPNSVIWLVPDRFEMRNQRTFKPPGRGIRSEASPPGHIQGVKNLTVDVELNLAGRRVTNPDRF